MTSSHSPSAGSFEARPPAGASESERSPEEIEAQIERTRQRLAQTVDAITERVKPANVARRQAESAKAQVLDEHGQVRVGRAAAVAAGVAAVIGMIVWRRRR